MVAAGQNQQPDFIAQHSSLHDLAARDVNNHVGACRQILADRSLAVLAATTGDRYWALEIVDRIAVGFIVNPDGRDMADQDCLLGISLPVNQLEESGIACRQKASGISADRSAVVHGDADENVRIVGDDLLDHVSHLLSAEALTVVAGRAGSAGGTRRASCAGSTCCAGRARRTVRAGCARRAGRAVDIRKVPIYPINKGKNKIRAYHVTGQAPPK